MGINTHGDRKMKIEGMKGRGRPENEIEDLKRTWGVTSPERKSIEKENQLSKWIKLWNSK